jgi:hypothetical protein
MKRNCVGILGAALLLLLPLSGAFAQSKMAASLDIGPTMAGLVAFNDDANTGYFAMSGQFEYLLKQHFSALGRIDVCAGQYRDNGVFDVGFNVHGRYYPVSNDTTGFFMDGGLGFSATSVEHDDEDTAFGLTLSLGAGYKIPLGSHFFVEPSLSYWYAKYPTSLEPGSYLAPLPYKWQLGLNIGARF